MTNTLDIIRQKTREFLGDDFDVSWLTDDLVLDAAKAEAITEASGTTEGNSIMREGDHWKWRAGCSLKQWIVWGGNIRTTRIVNCANGLLNYRIDWS